MKRIRTICAAMMCCAVVAGFSSCSKDDDQPNEPKVKMQLTGITITEDNETTVLSDFTYDNEGRLTSYKVDDNGYKKTYTYTYNGASIAVKCTYPGNSYTLTYNLTNGLVSSVTDSDGYMDTYSYTSNNMTKWKESVNYPGFNSSDIIYLWEGGNPIRETVGSHIINYSYSDQLCYIGNLQTLFDDYSSIDVELMGGSYWDPFLQHQGYFGNLPKNLVTSAINNGEVDWTLSYELNSNGYPTKITAKEDDDTAVMALTWK